MIHSILIISQSNTAGRGLLFDHACYMAELASRASTIAAALWHQGESDCNESIPSI